MWRDRLINYINRSRSYYDALGYTAYDWAHFPTVPFTRPAVPLYQAQLTLITTAGKTATPGDQGPGAAYNAEAKFFNVFTTPTVPTPDLRIAHLSYDRDHCQADDPNTWLPVNALKRAQDNTTVGALSNEVICLPTNRSQRVSIEQDCPNVVAHCQRLKTDVALLVPT